MRMVPVLAVAAIAAAVAIPLTRCTEKSGSLAENKSLDNMLISSTDVNRKNNCEANPSAGKPKNPAMAVVEFAPDVKNRESTYRSAVEQTLGSIPEATQEYFVKEYRGAITVTYKAADICGEKRSDPKSPLYLEPNLRADIAGCFIEEEPAKDGKRPKVHIYMMPDETVIKHNFVRTWAMLFSQYWARKNTDGTSAPEEPAKLSEVKEQLAETFLREILDGRLFDLSALEPLLSKEGIEKIQANYLSSAAGTKLLDNVLFGLKSSKGSDGKADPQWAYRRWKFLDHVFVQAYDSYFCRAFSEDGKEAEERKTLDALVKKYGRTVTLGTLKSRDDERNKALAQIYNTRLIMEEIFPQTFCQFEGIVVPNLETLTTGKRTTMPSAACRAGYADQSQGASLVDASMFMQLIPLFMGLIQQAGTSAATSAGTGIGNIGSNIGNSSSPPMDSGSSCGITSGSGST